MKRVAVWVDGDVQGVGFRWWALNVGNRLGLTGTVQNLWDGRVELHVQGEDATVDRMVAEVTGRWPSMRRPGTVTSHVIAPEPVVEGESVFDVR